MAIRVLIVDDHPIVRAGLVALLTCEPDLEVVGQATTGGEAVTLHAARAPDVTLMDLRLPGMDGIDAIRAIRQHDADARVVVLTSYAGDAEIFRALDAGACGYLLKDMLGEELVAAVRRAAAGRRAIPAAVATRLAEFTPRVDLTARELEVLRLAAKGLRNREIGRVLGRTEETVKVHLRHILAKLGVEDRTAAVALAHQRGIIRLDD